MRARESNNPKLSTWSLVRLLNTRIQEKLKKNFQCLILVPEIILTKEWVNEIFFDFGISAEIYHSSIKSSQKAKIWNHVILNKSIKKKLLKDSKSLTKSKREILSKYIKKNSTWAVGKASVKEIEKINILQASLLAMKRAIQKLEKKPTIVLIDGNNVPEVNSYKIRSIIKGDQKIPSISAASYRESST